MVFKQMSGKYINDWKDIHYGLWSEDEGASGNTEQCRHPFSPGWAAKTHGHRTVDPVTTRSGSHLGSDPRQLYQPMLPTLQSFVYNPPGFEHMNIFLLLFFFVCVIFTFLLNSLYVYTEHVQSLNLTNSKHPGKNPEHHQGSRKPAHVPFPSLLRPKSNSYPHF